VIEEVVRLLEDGQWHTSIEILRCLNLSEHELERTVNFLKRFSIISLDEKERRMRLDPSFLELPV